MASIVSNVLLFSKADVIISTSKTIYIRSCVSNIVIWFDFKFSYIGYPLIYLQQKKRFHNNFFVKRKLSRFLYTWKNNATCQISGKKILVIFRYIFNVMHTVCCDAIHFHILWNIIKFRISIELKRGLYLKNTYSRVSNSEWRLTNFLIYNKFKGPAKSFGYLGLKLLAGIRVIAEGLAQRSRPEPPTRLELHLFKLKKATHILPVFIPWFIGAQNF